MFCLEDELLGGPDTKEGDPLCVMDMGSVGNSVDPRLYIFPGFSMFFSI